MRLSIVVPVYRAEKYLTKCLDSIRSQEFTDFECILVDDGSPDNCPAICDEYAKCDSRFRVIHKENAGAGFAAKTGIMEAEGDYIGFVDSDDFIEPDMYSTMMNLADEYDLDACICNHRYVYEDGSKKSLDFGFEEGLYADDNISKLYNHLLPNLTSGKYLSGSRCNKIFRREIITNSAKAYNERISISEDTVLTHIALLNSKRVYYTKKELYNYFRNEASITGKYREEFLADWQRATSIYEPYRSCFSSPKAIEDAKFYWLIVNVVGFIHRSNISNKDKKRYIKNVEKNAYVQQVLRDVASSPKNKTYLRQYRILKYHLTPLYLVFNTIRTKLK